MKPFYETSGPSIHAQLNPYCGGNRLTSLMEELQGIIRIFRTILNNMKLDMDMKGWFICTMMDSPSKSQGPKTTPPQIIRYTSI